jgi:uncharacterized protein HemX
MPWVYSTDTDTGLATISSVSILAPMVEIRWQSSDRPASTSATPTVSPSTSPPASTHGPSGLSTGAKAAIGVVVPVVVIGIAAVLYGVLVVKRKRRQRQPAATRAAELEAGKDDVQTAPVYEMDEGMQEQAQELEARALHEVQGSDPYSVHVAK